MRKAAVVKGDDSNEEQMAGQRLGTSNYTNDVDNGLKDNDSNRPQQQATKMPQTTTNSLSRRSRGQCNT
jgi:hypothetical protein